MMGRRRYKIIQQAAPHFVTLTVLHWIPAFTRPQPVDIILNSLRFLMVEGEKRIKMIMLIRFGKRCTPPDIMLHGKMMRQKIDYIYHHPVQRG